MNKTMEQLDIGIVMNMKNSNEVKKLRKMCEDMESVPIFYLVLSPSMGLCGSVSVFSVGVVGFVNGKI